MHTLECVLASQKKMTESEILQWASSPRSRNSLSSKLFNKQNVEYGKVNVTLPLKYAEIPQTK